MMIRIFIFLGLITAGSFAQADAMMKTNMNVVCVEQLEDHTDTPRVVVVQSDENGSFVSVKGLGYYGQQLVTGTEGGDPYMQTVDNGYNIFISGDEMTAAFGTGTKVSNGLLSAHVGLFGGDSNDSFNANCKGSFSFN